MKGPKLHVVPCDLDEANFFIGLHHRHHPPVRGYKFAVAVATLNMNGDTPQFTVVGVATVGRPNARMKQDGWTLEVTRNCTDGTHNAASKLYAQCAKAAMALGYKKLITYTLKREAGSSLRAAGFRVVAEVRGQHWDRPSRRRKLTEIEPKQRWELELTA